MSRNRPLRHRRLADEALLVLALAIDDGDVVKPDGCELCGRARPRPFHVDFARPLDVRWLCRACTRQVSTDLVERRPVNVTASPRLRRVRELCDENLRSVFAMQDEPLYAIALRRRGPRLWDFEPTKWLGNRVRLCRGMLV